MNTSDIPYQTFNCPHCGAPGSVSYGQAQYTCMCRMRTFVTYTAQQCTKCHCQERAQEALGDPRVSVGVEVKP